MVADYWMGAWARRIARGVIPLHRDRHGRRVGNAAKMHYSGAVEQQSRKDTDMSKLTRAELNRRVAAQANATAPPSRDYLTPAAAEDVIDALCAVIAGALETGDEVMLPGIGRITTQDVPERHFRNPRTGERLLKPAHRRPKMVFSKPLKDRCLDH